jgi:hypothetical protein
MKTLLQSILLFACIIIATTPAGAQGWQWERHIVNSPFAVTSRPAALTTDTAGNVFSATLITGFSALLGGVTSSFGTQSIVDSTTAAQLIIAKTDPHGNVLWLTGTQHTGTGVANISTDKEGNMYVLGVYDSASGTLGDRPIAHDPLPIPSNTMYFIAKLNPAGQVVWAKNVVATSSFGFGGGAMAMQYLPHGSIKADDSGHLYVCGTFINGGLTIGTTPLTLTGDQNIFIAKYDTAGNPLWAKTYGSTGVDYPFNTGLAPDGTLYMAGTYYAPSTTFGTITLTNTSGAGAFVAKFDNNGNTLWAKTTDSFVYMFDIAVDTAANAYVCGRFSAGSVNFNTHSITNTSTDHSDGFMVKYDKDGNNVWAINMGSDSSETAEKITTDNCGNIFITGVIDDIHKATEGYNLHFGDQTHYLPVNSFADFPMFIAHYSDAGQYVNCISLRGGGANQPKITTDKKGHFYIGTQFTNADTLSTSILARDSGEMYKFIARFDYDSVGCILYASLPVQDINMGNVRSVTLCPNPATTEFFLASDVAFTSGTTVTIVDMAGKAVYNTQVNGTTAAIPVHQLSPGVYSCVINMGAAGIVYKKMIVAP